MADRDIALHEALVGGVGQPAAGAHVRHARGRVPHAPLPLPALPARTRTSSDHERDRGRAGGRRDPPRSRCCASTCASPRGWPWNGARARRGARVSDGRARRDRHGRDGGHRARRHAAAARRGRALVLVARARRSRARGSSSELGGERAAFVAGDVGDPATADAAVAAARERFGGLDVLINNAGLDLSGPALLDTTLARTPAGSSTSTSSAPCRCCRRRRGRCASAAAARSSTSRRARRSIGLPGLGGLRGVQGRAGEPDPRARPSSSPPTASASTPWRRA